MDLQTSEGKLTSNGVDQELVGWHAVLEKQADHPSRTLPGDGEWVVKGNAAVIGIGDRDLCIGQSKGRAQNEDLQEMHLDNQSVFGLLLCLSAAVMQTTLWCCLVDRLRFGQEG